MASDPKRQALVVEDLKKTYEDVVAVDGIELERVGGRVFRPARTEWRRQDHDHRDLRRPDAAGFRPGRSCWACAGKRMHRICVSDSAFSCRRRSSPTSSRSSRRCGCFGASSRQGPPPDDAIAMVATRRKARRPRGRAVRWTEAAAGARLRARRRSGPAVSRRADHRTRPAGAPPAVGLIEEFKSDGRTIRAHHTLHGRGGTAVRPGGHHGSRHA